VSLLDRPLHRWDGYCRRLDRLADRIRGERAANLAWERAPFLHDGVDVRETGAIATDGIRLILAADSSQARRALSAAARDCAGVSVRPKPAFDEMAGWEPRP
jgi:hypothetical protein